MAELDYRRNWRRSAGDKGRKNRAFGEGRERRIGEEEEIRVWRRGN